MGSNPESFALAGRFFTPAAPGSTSELQTGSTTPLWVSKGRSFCCTFIRAGLSKQGDWYERAVRCSVDLRWLGSYNSSSSLVQGVAVTEKDAGYARTQYSIHDLKIKTLVSDRPGFKAQLQHELPWGPLKNLLNLWSFRFRFSTHKMGIKILIPDSSTCKNDMLCMKYHIR